MSYFKRILVTDGVEILSIDAQSLAEISLRGYPTAGIVIRAPTGTQIPVALTNGTNLMPTMDAAIRKGYVAITDGTYIAEINEEGHIIAGSALHHRIINSAQWAYSKRWEGVADNGTAILRITTASGYTAHGNFYVQTEGKVYIDIYEGTTFSVAGTDVTELCQNRDTIIAPNTIIRVDPTVDAIGTPLEQALLGSAGKFIDAGGTDGANMYWLLADNQDYIIQVTNKSGNAADIVIGYTWHERTT